MTTDIRRDRFLLEQTRWGYLIRDRQRFIPDIRLTNSTDADFVHAALNMAEALRVGQAILWERCCVEEITEVIEVALAPSSQVLN